MAIHGVKDGELQELKPSEVDLELPTANQLFGSHINLIPLQNNVQGPRLFYGARFYNQAMPLKHNEAPLVQAAIEGDEQGRSFDDLYGKAAGAVFADSKGKIEEVTPDEIHHRGVDGHKKKIPL